MISTVVSVDCRSVECDIQSVESLRESPRTVKNRQESSKLVLISSDAAGNSTFGCLQLQPVGAAFHRHSPPTASPKLAMLARYGENPRRRAVSPARPSDRPSKASLWGNGSRGSTSRGRKQKKREESKRERRTGSRRGKRESGRGGGKKGVKGHKASPADGLCKEA